MPTPESLSGKTDIKAKMIPKLSSAFPRIFFFISYVLYPFLPKILHRVTKKNAARHSYVSYRGGLKVRNCGRPKPEAKTVGVPPPGGYFKMSPPGARFDSATKRLPELSKAKPRGLVIPVAKVLSTPP